MREAGLKVTCGPPEESVEVRDTMPENPLRLVNVTITLPDDPRGTVSEDGLKAIAKSGIATVTVIIAECVPGEPVPVTVTE